MEQSEVLKRVIGILTEAGEWQRLLEEDVERDDLDAESGIVTALLNETMPNIEIPSDATIEEIAALVGREVGGTIQQLVGAFSLAFMMLAQVHDSGHSEISSSQVLRDLALRAEEISADDDPGSDPSA
ncbi:hypothetical protein [Streptomyces sp. NPDC088725]|uniref:hypothetical protein n=1 Tax=Streptomyces sp. NPDC088725 TaxID=3365873 RepID=UPI0037FBA440